MAAVLVSPHDVETEGIRSAQRCSSEGSRLKAVAGLCPECYWTPVGLDADRLVLLGHGGSADKKADYIELIAHGLCSLGVAAVAIDGPGHGDRPGADQFETRPQDFAVRWESDGGTSAIVADWNKCAGFHRTSRRCSGNGLSRPVDGHDDGSACLCGR